MNVEIINSVIQLGLGGLALYLFYMIVSNITKQHSKERREDSELWRNELRDRGEKTDAVIKELTNVIRDIKSK